MPRLLTAALGLMVLVAGSSPVHAQSIQNAAIAEALFREGQELMTAGKVADACAKFSASLQLDPALGTLLNLAACHEKQGRFASAWAEFSDVAARAAQQGQKDRESYARGRVKALEPKLVRGSIVVPQPVDGIVVTVDGNPVPAAAWGIPLPFDAGAHLVEATASGFETWRAEVTIPARGKGPKIEVPKLLPSAKAPAAPGATVAAVASPAPTADPAPAQASAQKQAAPEPASVAHSEAAVPSEVLAEAVESGARSTPRLVAGGGLLAAGLGSAGTAVFFGLKAKGLAGDRDALCPPGQACYSQAAFDADHDARASQQLAAITGIAGALAVGTGAVLLIGAFGDDGAKAEQDAKGAPDAGEGWSSIWFAPTAAARSVGFSFGGIF